MSRIKILLAEEENIDDLKVPVHFGKDFFDSVQEQDLKRLVGAVVSAAKRKETEEEIALRANYTYDYGDEGDLEAYLENFLEIIEDIATDWTDEIVATQHYDLSDTEYAKVIELAKDLLADYYADYESQLCSEALDGSKYKLDEMREKEGRC